MPSGHVTGGAPLGTGRQSSDSFHCESNNTLSNHSCIKPRESPVSGNAGHLPLQSPSPALGAGPGEAVARMIRLINIDIRIMPCP